MTDKIVVFTSCGSREEANRIAETLVSRGLAACVSIVPGAESVYLWKGEVERSSELLLIAKTTRAAFPELRSALAAIHSYEVPELLALPVADGAQSYLDWIDSVVFLKNELPFANLNED